MNAQTVPQPHPEKPGMFSKILNSVLRCSGSSGRKCKQVDTLLFEASKQLSPSEQLVWFSDMLVATRIASFCSTSVLAHNPRFFGLVATAGTSANQFPPPTVYQSTPHTSGPLYSTYGSSLQQLLLNPGTPILINLAKDGVLCHEATFLVAAGMKYMAIFPACDGGRLVGALTVAMKTKPLSKSLSVKLQDATQLLTSSMIRASNLFSNPSGDCRQSSIKDHAVREMFKHQSATQEDSTASASCKGKALCMTFECSAPSYSECPAPMIQPIFNVAAARCSSSSLLSKLSELRTMSDALMICKSGPCTFSKDKNKIMIPRSKGALSFPTTNETVKSGSCSTMQRVRRAATQIAAEHVAGAPGPWRQHQMRGFANRMMKQETAMSRMGSRLSAASYNSDLRALPFYDTSELTAAAATAAKEAA